jgi:hypothetical protein
MDAIEALSRMLSRVNGDAARDFIVPVDEHVKKLQEVQERLRLRLRKMGDPKSHGDIFERIKAALLACRAGATLDFRQLRLACWGCTMTFQPDNYVLLTDGAAMKRLAQFVDAERGEPRVFAKLYGRLLRAYFGHADASKKGGADREPLREYLAAWADIVLDLPFRTSWAQAITEHPELLSKHPGQEFAGAILAGDWTSFKLVSEQLGLTGETWLTGAALRGAAAAAQEADDKVFKTRLPKLLFLIGDKRFATLRDEILAGLIERYHKCRVPEVHKELRDFAVAAWKNPWLPLNEMAWGRVSNAARQMISNWLKLDLIFEFFNVLAEDGRGDRNRFEFWRRYLGRIDDIYFVLGGRTLNSTNPNIRALRRKLEGRLMHLTGAEPANNAFIMRIGNAIIVEFSRTGNAMFPYKSDQLPFSLNGVQSNIDDLKCDKENKLSHTVGAGGQSWQERFEQALRARFNISPDSGSRNASAAPAPAFTSPRTPAAPRTKAGFDVFELRKLMERENLKWDDQRARGGNLWVRSDDVPPRVKIRLVEWGFRLKQGKGWWLSAMGD